MADVQDILGAPPTKPTIEEILGPKELNEAQQIGGQFYEDYLQHGLQGKLLDQFGQGFKEGWGTKPLGELSPELEKALSAQQTTQYKSAITEPFRLFNEGLMRSTALMTDFLMRTPYALARGLAATGGPEAVIGGVAAAGMEAFPAGHFTGLPIQIPHVERAHDFGITNERIPGPTPNEAARQSLTPTQVESPTQRVIAAETADPIVASPELAAPLPPPVDVYEAARRIAPDVFAEYDPLVQQKEAFRQQLETAKANDPRAVAAQQEIDTILGKVNGVESRLTKRTASRLDEIRGDLDAFMRGPDTPEMAAVRRDMMAVDARMRDMAPDVSTAYRDARAAMPEPPQAALEPAPLSEPISAPTATTTEAEPPNVLNLLQRRPTIAAEVARDLQAAGRPAEEARAAAALVQAHYEARAARFQGALGSARALYDRDAPTIQAAEGAHRGALTLSTNTMRLMQDADASTFLHETAHGWFEEFMRDAQHPQAPADLVADVNAVKAWLQIRGDRPSRANHELFARGFERYMMEGVAPTARLAGVFAKFRDWLTSIYQTVARLRAPISDEIRGVYDRLLATPRSETVVAPEREVAQNFADVHEADLAAARPEDALAKADEIAAEREQVSQILSMEIQNARRRARASRNAGRPKSGGETPSGEAGAGVGKSSGAGPSSIAVGEEPAAQPTEIVPSGATFKAEGKPSGGPNEGFIDGGSRAVDKAGNIRLDLLDAPADVDQAIRDAARYNSDYQTERRGVVSDGQLLDLADALGIDASFLDAKKVGDAFTAEEIVAARMLLVESASQVKNMMAAAAEGGDVVELAKAIARHEMIQGKVAQATAEWGRAGHAFQLLSKVSKETDVDALNTLLKENTGRSYDQLMQMAALGRNLQTPSQVSRFVQATKNQRISRALVYYYTNALISGPFTHAVYVLGNQLRSALMPVETATQAAIGSARSLVMTDPDRVYWKEVGASLDGLMYGTPAAFRPALDAFKAGQQLPLPGQKLYTNPWGTYQPLIPAAIDNAVGLPGRSVAAIHQFSRVVFYEQFLRRLATRQAMAEGLSGDELTGRIAKLISSPPDEMMQNAADRADTEMFQRRSSFTGPLAAISRATDNYPLAKLFFPFIKIGVEIQRETFVKRTPLGLLSPEVRGQLLMREGGAAFDEAAGKQVLGLSLLGAGVGFAATGITTGYGPTDPKARSSWLLTHQPYSVTIGNLSVPYQGLGPPGKLLQFGADLFETHHYWDEKDGAALAASYVKAVARATLDESFFTDMTSLNDAISDPGRHGARWLTGFAAGFVPYSSFLGQTNRHIIDPYSKDVSPGIEGIFDNIRARIPVASWDIPNRVDMFGEDIPSRGIYGGFMPELRWHNDPTAQWLNRIQVGPGRVDRSIWGVRLTELQYHDLQQQSGRLSKQLLDAVREQLQGQPRGVQLKEIDRLIGEARSATRKQIAMQSIGSDNDIVAKAVKLKEQAFQ